MPGRNDPLSEETFAVLRGLAYRILGSRADAEDAVQDSLLQWQNADRTEIENPAAWLTTVCTRRCIDLLRSAHRSRVDYVGPWLPEPVIAAAGTSEEKLELAASLSTAFLLLLERLTPRERAAYLLHEIFDAPYPQVARTLGLQESACRKLVSRARANIAQSRIRHVTPVEQQQKLLAAFRSAVVDGSTEPLAALLSDHVELSADSGGKVAAATEIISGRQRVLDFITQDLHRYWAGYAWNVSDINGGRGMVLHSQGVVAAVVSIACDEAGGLTNIFIMRNPDKLAGMRAAAIF
jgi:RNA polymerase sigma-70 factor (ECF subfamily)